jgi:hypothetical protein
MPATVSLPPIHLTKREAAQFLHISERTLDRLSVPRLRLRGRVMFRRDTLDQWSKSQESPAPAQS